MVLRDDEEAKKLAEDPFYKLEHGNEDKRKAKEAAPIIQDLQVLKEEQADDFACNQVLRHIFRVCIQYTPTHLLLGLTFLLTGEEKGNRGKQEGGREQRA